MPKQRRKSDDEQGANRVHEARRVYGGKFPLVVARDLTVHVDAAKAAAYEREIDQVQPIAAAEYAQ